MTFCIPVLGQAMLICDRSENKGVRKKPVHSANLKENFGIEDDAVEAAQAILDKVDSDDAIIAPNASDLDEAFETSPLFAADLIDFSLTVDTGLGPVEIFDESDLIGAAGNFELNEVLNGLSHSLGATNTVTATAMFDTNNDGFEDQTLTAQTIINGTDGSDIIFG